MYKFRIPLLNLSWYRRPNLLDSGEDQRLLLLNHIGLIFRNWWECLVEKIIYIVNKCIIKSNFLVKKGILIQFVSWESKFIYAISIDARISTPISIFWFGRSQRQPRRDRSLLDPLTYILKIYLKANTNANLKLQVFSVEFGFFIPSDLSWFEGFFSSSAGLSSVLILTRVE